jgi:PBSX family phage terminase large subunit
MPETEIEIRTHEFVLESFWDFWVACDNPQYTHYVCKGGRNSAKSTTISQRLNFDVLEKPINCLIVRKVSNTLYDSVYQQLHKSLNIMNVDDEFTFYKSPLSIIYKARGNGFLFRGADDPGKIKSITSSNYPITQIWFEEVDQFKTEDELQMIIDSILRENLPDGMKYKFFYSYNPPKRKQHWLNRKFETQFVPKNTYVHHSYYYHNPYLAQQTLDEIEHVKQTNIKKYNWMYLGQPTGGGIVPFENLNFRRIEDSEYKSFDNIRQGIDWGYASDPFAFVRWHYDRTKKIIYAMDELYGVKLQNPEIMRALKQKNYDRFRIRTDTNEPKSVDEFKQNGFVIETAKKGAGSVEYGEKWLDGLEEIVIDPQRTPNIAREFEMIDYQIDKDGNQKPKLEEKDDHTISATRYAFEADFNKSGTRFF